MFNQSCQQLDLRTALVNIETRYGKGSVMRLGETDTLNVSYIPTGIDSLDIALGIGGIPKGRIIEIFGGESSGKTTLSLLIAAQVQQSGGTAVFIDMEHALDPAYAESLGVDIDSLLVSQPDTGEQAFEICEILMKSKAVDLIIFDSVAAMVTQAEFERDYEDGNRGLLARLMSNGLKRITSIFSKHKTTIIFTNQLRESIEVIYGNPEHTCGGRALKFYSSIRLDMRRQEQIKQGYEVIGQRTKVKVVKNKVASPFKVAQFDLLFNGI